MKANIYTLQSGSIRKKISFDSSEIIGLAYAQLNALEKHIKNFYMSVKKYSIVARNEIPNIWQILK